MRKTQLFAAAAIMALALAAAGCSKVEETSSFLTIDLSDEKSCVIEMDSADEGSSVSSAALVIEDGEEFVIEPSLEEGSEVLIQLKAGAENESADTLPDMSDPDYETKIMSNGVMRFTAEPGSYRINVLPQKKSTGTILMSVRSAEAAGEGATPLEAEEAAGGHTNWTECATAEEAAKGAGLDSLADLNGTMTSMGEIGTMGEVKYRYMQDIVQVFCPVAAVDMSAIKAKSYVANGDVSLDNSEYAHEWTQDVDGQEVKCFGNREGEATKTIWTAGDYAYAVVAYGAGGDVDFGLKADDVATMVKAFNN